MRTDKHKLTLSLEQETKLLEIIKAYQEEKNFFSDMLNGYSWNSGKSFLIFGKAVPIEKLEALWLSKIMFLRTINCQQELGNWLLKKPFSYMKEPS